MLSIEQNELLTRLGPGTPMGVAIREIWAARLRSANGAPEETRSSS